MRPGAWTPEGFLTDDDSLADVLARDAETLERLGVTGEAIATRLRDLLDAGSGSDWMLPAQVGSLRVELHRTRGFLTCPWAPEEFVHCQDGPDGRPTANTFTLVRPDTGTRLVGFELAVHTIRAHSFFGGPSTPFRIEPERAAEFLEGELGRGHERST